jgi:hypothetical protein
MHLVAITSLGPNTELGALAAELGTTAYELKLTLAAGLPSVVSVCPDQIRAGAVVSAIERRGHRAVACDRDRILPSSGMVALKDFRLDEIGLAADGSRGEHLPYDDVLTLLRATQRTATRETKEVKEKKFSVGRAIATGGLVNRKTTTREVTTQTTTLEQVLYLFRRSGATPWILCERGARYTGLGENLRPTSLENFVTTMRRLRELAPAALYDERLMHSRPIRAVADGAEATDILAHLIALDFARR